MKTLSAKAKIVELPFGKWICDCGVWSRGATAEISQLRSGWL